MARKRFHKPYQEYFIIDKGDQALVTSGNFVQSDASVGVADGQISAVATRPFGSYDVGEFVAGSATISTVPHVKFVQGTPGATNNSSHYGWFNEDRGYVDTPEVGPNSIQSVGLFLPNVGKYSAVSGTGFAAALLEDKEYQLHINMRSVRKDRDFGPNKDQITYSYMNADLSGIADNRGKILQHLLYQVNLSSQLSNLAPSDIIHRTREFVALGINTGGSNTGGTVLGTLKTGDTLPVQTDGTTTMNWTVPKALIQTLTDAIANVTAITATSTIETLNLTTAGTGTRATGTFQVTAFANMSTDTITIGSTALVEGTDFDAITDDDTTATNLAAAIDAVSGYSATATTDTVTVVYDTYGTAGNSVVWTYTDGGTSGGTISGSGTLTGAADTNVDAFLIVGLDEDLSQAYDNIHHRKVTVECELGGQFYTDSTGTITRAAGAEETKGDGRGFKILYDERAFAQTGSQQLSGHTDTLLLATNYINQDAQYTHTVVDIREDSETPMGNDTPNQFRVHFLVLATDDSASATPGGGGITTSSASTTAVASLESVIGSWVQSHDNIAFNGSATASTTFV